jgi:hypothetical protein
VTQSINVRRAVLPFLVAIILLLAGLAMLLGPSNPSHASAESSSVVAPSVVEGAVVPAPSPLGSSCYVPGDMIGEANPATVYAMACQ